MTSTVEPAQHDGMGELRSVYKVLMVALFVMGSVACDASSPVVEAFIPNEHNDIVVYTELCKAELGIEAVTLPPMNCLDGVEIPVTVGGVPPDEATYEALSRGEIGCDSPSWFLGSDCENASLIQTLDITPDIEAVLLCRMRSYSSHLSRAERLVAYEANPTVEAYRSLFSFDSFGMIWTHKKTGKTCFFERNAGVYGGYVPSPDDPTPPEAGDLPVPAPPEEFLTDEEQVRWWRRGAREVWTQPIFLVMLGQCTGCHDSGPFIRTPWLRDLNVVPAHDPTRPYQVVGTGYESWNLFRPLLAISTLDVPGPDGVETSQMCTSCHRIGAHRTCFDAVPYYTAGRVPPGMAEEGATFRGLARMPPVVESWTDLGDEDFEHTWDEEFGAHLAMLGCCCENRHALGCTTQDLSQNPLGPPEEGMGPASCLDFEP